MSRTPPLICRTAEKCKIWRWSTKYPYHKGNWVTVCNGSCCACVIQLRTTGIPSCGLEVALHSNCTCSVSPLYKFQQPTFSFYKCDWIPLVLCRKKFQKSCYASVIVGMVLEAFCFLAVCSCMCDHIHKCYKLLSANLQLECKDWLHFEVKRSKIKLPARWHMVI